MKKLKDKLITPEYTRKNIKKYELKTKEFRKRVWPCEFEKLLAYWKELIASRHERGEK